MSQAAQEDLGYGQPDLHLQAASPCIGAGNINIIKDTGETDYDGNPLIQNGSTSLGAYQSH